ncbi:MAG: hypothetical protein AAB785_01280 [Patescibacteria group bacterium]
MNLKKFYDYLAFGISVLFSPYITAAIFILVIIYRYATNLSEFLPWLGIAFFFGLIIPGGNVLWLLEKKVLNDIHLSNHKQRKIPFIVTGISATIGAIALSLVGAAKQVVVMGTVYAVNTVMVALLTLFWKVSVHTALLSAIVTVMTILFGIQYGWFYLLLIPLAWSRIYRHRHTLNQVVGGALIAFVLTALVFWLFDYL